MQRDVLIVEEDRRVRELFQHIFLGAGYKCRLAGDLEEGLEAFRESRPPLVITDLRMPMAKGDKSERDAGIRLLLEIRHEDPNVAVIVCTGGPEAKFLVESLKLGAYAFLVKPVNVDELLITAARALERRQLLVERRQYETALKALCSALEVAKAGICTATHSDRAVVASFFKAPEALLGEIRRKSGEL